MFAAQQNRETLGRSQPNLRVSRNELMSDLPKTVRQIVPALGVILSLTFVGLEVRQNTLVARGATVQAIAEQGFEITIAMAQDEHWPRLQAHFEGGGLVSELSAEEMVRFRNFAMATVRIMENRYRQLTLGVLSEDDLGGGGGTAISSWWCGPAFQAYWTDSAPETSWEPALVQFMEQRVLAACEG